MSETEPTPPEFRTNGVAVALGLAAVAAIALAAIFILLLRQTVADQDQRIARLEALAKAHSPAFPGAFPTEHASRADRIAMLLAAGGDRDSSRPVLAPLSIPDCAAIARDLLARPAASDRNAALSAVMARIADSEPATAAALLAEVTDPALRAPLAGIVLNDWIHQSPDAAGNWLATQGVQVLDADTLDRQLARAAERWSAYDPAAATLFLLAQSKPGETSLEELTTVAAAWGRKDPAAAVRSAQAIPTLDPRRLSVLQGAITGWAEQQPARAANYLQAELYSGGDGGELYVALAGDVADRWAKTQLEAAAQWAGSLTSRRAQREALQRVAAVWAQTDLAGAARWAAALPGGSPRGEAWEAIVGAWPSDDLDGEGTWISNLPAGTDRDEAISAHAGKLAAADPEKALTWAGTIDEGDYRVRNIQGILANWETRDRVSARNWAAANGVELPPSGRRTGRP